MLERLGLALRRWVEDLEPRTNVYGLARTLLAIGTLTTLVASPTTAVFRALPGMPVYPNCTARAAISLFCLVPPTHLEIARWIAVVVLLVVAVGWRPRITGILHWWVAFSVMASATIIDGGDQVTAILALALIPLTLIDPRRTHWDAPPATSSASLASLRRFFVLFPAVIALAAIRLQVAGIYFQAADAKTRVEEWRDGTAIYYWFSDPSFGVPPWLAPFVAPLLTHGPIVTAVTWGSIALEFFLFAGLLMRRRYRPWLLVAGISFHLGIGVIHGLISFAFAMWAALILYLWPVDQPFVLPAWVRMPAPNMRFVLAPFSVITSRRDGHRLLARRAKLGVQRR